MVDNLVIDMSTKQQYKVVIFQVIDMLAKQQHNAIICQEEELTVKPLVIDTKINYK